MKRFVLLNLLIVTVFVCSASAQSERRLDPGVHVGMGLDPELAYVGVHAWAGPILPRLWLRPSVDFGFGELTKVLSVNPEAVYIFADTGDNYGVYAGAGLALQVFERSFNEEQNGQDVRFSDWNWETGLNLILGLSRPNGLMGEIRAGSYGSPGVKIMIGYNF